MSEIRVNNIIDEAGTGAPTFPNGATVTGSLVATATTATTAGALAAGATGADLTLSGNLTVNGTTTTIDTAVTSVDSIAVDGAGTFGGTVRVNHTGNVASDQLARLGNVNNSGTNSAHLFLANGYYVSPTDVDGTGAAAKILADGTISDSMGPLRRLGINAQTGAYSVTTTDAGKLIRVSNTGNITIPTGLNPGDMVSIVSHHASTNTIVQGSGLTLYNTADGSTGNRTLAARGVCTILWSHSDTAYISGSGLT